MHLIGSGEEFLLPCNSLPNGSVTDPSYLKMHIAVLTFFCRYIIYRIYLNHCETVSLADICCF